MRTRPLTIAVDQATLHFSTPLTVSAAALAGTVFDALEVPAGILASTPDAPAVLAASGLSAPVVSCGLGVPADLSVSDLAWPMAVERWAWACGVAGAAGARHLSVYVPQHSGLSAAVLARRLAKLTALAAAGIGLGVLVEFSNLASALSDDTWAALRPHCAGLILDVAAMSLRAGGCGDLLGLLDRVPRADVRWIHLADVAVTDGGPQRVVPGDGILELAVLWQEFTPEGISVEVFADRGGLPTDLRDRIALLDSRVRELCEEAWA